MTALAPTIVERDALRSIDVDLNFHTRDATCAFVAWWVDDPDAWTHALIVQLPTLDHLAGAELLAEHLVRRALLPAALCSRRVLLNQGKFVAGWTHDGEPVIRYLNNVPQRDVVAVGADGALRVLHPARLDSGLRVVQIFRYAEEFALPFDCTLLPEDAILRFWPAADHPLADALRARLRAV